MGYSNEQLEAEVQGGRGEKAILAFLVLVLN